MIINEPQLEDILMKNKKIPKKEAFRIFLREFNKEAKKQNSKWFAEVLNLDDADEEHHFLHISKFIGWWIFKEKVSIFVNDGNRGYYSFVENDYSVSEYSEEKNRNIFKLMPEFENILKKINLPFFILEDYKKEDFEKKVREIKEGIKKIENKIIRVKGGKEKNEN